MTYLIKCVAVGGVIHATERGCTQSLAGRVFTPLHVATALSLLQVIDMEGFVLLNVRRTLLLLNRLFIRGEVAHRSSIHRRISLSIASTSNAKS